MQFTRRVKGPVLLRTAGLVIVGLLLLGMTSCNSSYQPVRRTEPHLEPGWPRGNDFFHQASYGEVRATLPEIPDAEYVDDDEFCLTCHGAYAEAFADNVHRGDSCESCHGPASRHLETRGQEPGLIFSFKTSPPAQRAEVCLKCHEKTQCEPGAKYRFSKHAQSGVSCTDCHRNHYNVPPGTPATTNPNVGLPRGQHDGVQPAGYYGLADKALPSLRGTSNHLGAVAPGVCYRCHGDMVELQQIAGPHQIGGLNGFNCTTCHDPHGNIKETSRTELCLECHKESSPIMAFHSSTHYLEGVACTDCHNPHPRSDVPRVVSVSHTNVRRPSRLPMSVDEPETCYKCHPDIFGLTRLPSHHPIREGKMVCSDCHDSHGQFEANLNADSVNDVCYKCHAEKQGPFVYKHPPVTEDCGYCHQPHGTVANNLLKQPPTFLCLRCHSGHRGGPAFHVFTGLLADFGSNPGTQQAFYTDCTQCHSQIHGSDVPSPHRPRSLMR